MALNVKISADGSGFAAALNKMTEDAANFGKNLSGKVAGNFNQAIMGVVPGLTSAIAGVFAADSVKTALTDFAKRGEEIKFGGIRLGVDSETFERIDNVMKAVGQDAGAVDSAFDKMAEGLTKIEEGGAGADKLRTAFAQLGISADDLKGKNVPDMFFKIAESMKGIVPSKEQFAALREIYGKSGDNLVPAFSVGFKSATATSGLLDADQMKSINLYNAEMREAKRTGAGSINWVKSQGLDVVSGALATWRQLTHSFGAYMGQGDSGPNAAQEEIKDNMTRKATAFAAQKALQEQQQRELKAGQDKIAANDTKREFEALHKAEAKMDADEAKKKVAAQLPERMQNLGNQSIGGIMLGHDRLGEMVTHARRTVVLLASIDNKTHPPARGGLKKDFP